jgi:uncharacterized membrane protein
MNVPTAASRRLTSGALGVGVVITASCFLVALGSEFAGNDSLTGDMTDATAVIEGIFSLAPWAWASLGTYAIVLTPVIGLLATAYEYAAIADRRTMWLAVAVLAILGVSVATAILR